MSCYTFQTDFSYRFKLHILSMYFEVILEHVHQLTIISSKEDYATKLFITIQFKLKIIFFNKPKLANYLNSKL